MANIKIPKIEGSAFRSWAFVLIAGVVLTLVAVVDRGGFDLAAPSTADSAAVCRLTVSADELNVRSDPDGTSAVVQTLTRGAELPATAVVTSGFRELGDGHWAADEFLTPAAGTTCP